MRVVLRPLWTSGLSGQLDRHARPEVDDLRVAAAVGDLLAHPSVEVVPVGEDDLRVGRAGHVAGPRLVFVRIGVWGEDLVDVHPIPADGADEVADLGGGGDDSEPAGAG